MFMISHIVIRINLYVYDKILLLSGYICMFMISHIVIRINLYVYDRPYCYQDKSVCL